MRTKYVGGIMPGILFKRAGREGKTRPYVSEKNAPWGQMYPQNPLTPQITDITGTIMNPTNKLI
jgi:hypothetical protein